MRHRHHGLQLGVAAFHFFHQSVEDLSKTFFVGIEIGQSHHPGLSGEMQNMMFKEVLSVEKSKGMHTKPRPRLAEDVVARTAVVISSRHDDVHLWGLVVERDKEVRQPLLHRSGCLCVVINVTAEQKQVGLFFLYDLFHLSEHSQHLVVAVISVECAAKVPVAGM